MNDQKLIPHLFRTEFGKITAVLSRYFGLEYIETAEDIASDTFLLAVETWPYRGIPENPTAWLYTVAKNKARNALHRNEILQKKIVPQIKMHSAVSEEMGIDLSEQNISDSQLKMLFAVCHPSIPMESQVGLALRILCGFGIEEIADAFLTNKETINKRLYRAREKLREAQVSIEMPGTTEIDTRLDAVLTTLYLLFSEGYYSETSNAVLREELCAEAMRLTLQLIENEQTNLPKVNALMSLMCFHSSRFPARKNEHGEMILYQDQDESLWIRELIAKGAYYLTAASTGDQLSSYHLEAGIAYWHTKKEDSQEKWENILQLYNRLLQFNYSPVAALNRTYALSKVHGRGKAIIEAEKLKLSGSHFYYLLLAELYKGIDNEKAKANLSIALSMARTNSVQHIIQSQIDKLSDNGNV
jgi:RNA polymerase sigma-70 factor (ECF subfamily)